MNLQWLKKKRPSKLTFLNFRKFWAPDNSHNPLAIMKARGMLNFVSNEQLITKQ